MSNPKKWVDLHRSEGLRILRHLYFIKVEVMTEEIKRQNPASPRTSHPSLHSIGVGLWESHSSGLGGSVGVQYKLQVQGKKASL